MNRPDEPSAWSLQSALDRLRNDHESAYRDQKRLEARIDQAEKDIRALLVIPVEIRNLTASMDKLSKQLESITESASVGQRWAWQQLVAVASLLISVALIVFTIARVH